MWWRTNEDTDVSNPATYTFPVAMNPSPISGAHSDDCSIFGTMRDVSNIVNPNIEIYIAYNSSTPYISSVDDGIYARTINGAGALSTNQIYLYFSLLTWKLIIS